jgi:hypothetical protein
MTTLNLWINASLNILQDHLYICKEIKNDLDKLIIQAYALKKEVDSFVNFLERKKKTK